MKNALIVTSVASMVDQFLMPNICLLQALGYRVFVACNFLQGNTCSDEKIDGLKLVLEQAGVTIFQIDFARNVAKITTNWSAYKQLCEIFHGNLFDVIHCHSPIGGLLARLGAWKTRKRGTRVFYTAHGFHFYKGAPLKNWLLYYPIEKLCSYFTDVLVTINEEDYILAQRKMKAKTVVYVPGVGIDLDQFGTSTADKAAKRTELGIPQDATLLLSVGELNSNKNHETVLRAIAETDAYYCIAGQGDLRERLQSVIDSLGMTNRVKLLGFRKDVKELYQAADIFVFPSYREGLSVSLMEAMTSRLPCAVSRIRGNIDLISEDGGVLFDPHSVEECKQAIERLLKSDQRAMGKHNAQRIQRFSVEHVNDCMREIYCGILPSEDSENDDFKRRPIS